MSIIGDITNKFILCVDIVALIKNLSEESGFSDMALNISASKKVFEKNINMLVFAIEKYADKTIFPALKFPAVKINGVKAQADHFSFPPSLLQDEDFIYLVIEKELRVLDDCLNIPEECLLYIPVNCIEKQYRGHLDASLPYFAEHHSELVDIHKNVIDEQEPQGKSKTGYLNIIQALRDELLATGKYKNQTELIEYLVDKYQGYTGLSESNLRDKFAQANQIK